MERCLRNDQTPTATMVQLGRLLDARRTPAQPGQRYADVLSLAVHWGKHSPDEMEGYAQVANLMVPYMGGEDALGISMREAVEVLCRLKCNSHTLVDGDLREYGAGLYPLAALVNHSCAPNCVQSFTSGGVIEMRAMRALGEGEEVTMSYVDLAQPLKERRAELLSRYCFECACSSCTEPSEHEDFKARITGDCEPARKACKQADSKGWRSQADQMVAWVRAVEACEAVYHPLNVELMRAREKALKVAGREKPYPGRVSASPQICVYVPACASCVRVCAHLRACFCHACACVRVWCRHAHIFQTFQCVSVRSRQRKHCASNSVAF